MADTYEIVDGTVQVATRNRIEIAELRARRDFWNAEIARIKADYQAQLAAAQEQRAAVIAAIQAARDANIEGAAE